MENIKIAIVEDDEIIAQTIVLMLKRLGYECLAPAASFDAGIELIKNDKADVFLLDINLKCDKDGIELAKVIQKISHKPFIYLTSETSKNTIDRAIKTKPSAYLVKPFKSEDLYSAIELSLSHYPKAKSVAESSINKSKSLFIKQEQAFVKIDQSSIFYIKSEHVYLSVFLSNGKTHLVRGSLKDFIEQLSTSFIRTHRSYIVNKEHLESYNNKQIVIDNQILPIGEKYLESFIKAMK